MNLKGTIILSIISLLERLSYYGVRAILVLYATDPTALNIDSTQTLEYYGYWASAIVVVAIPFSLITDKFLGQRNSIYIGGVISLIGYIALLYQNNYALLFSLALILIGTSLVKPSITVLIGRQFKKENKKRTLAFMIFFLGINIGAFIGIVGIGYIGEIYDWTFGFTLAAISTLTYLIFAYLLRSQIQEVETNTLINSNFRFTLSKSVAILPLLILINIIFWKSHELESSELINAISSSSSHEVLTSMIYSILSFWTIPLTIFVFAYWYIKGVTDTFKAISIALLFLIGAVIATSILLNIDSNRLLEFSMLPFALYAFAEVIISPILTSYVTRISDIKFSNTIYSTYIFLTYTIGAGLVYLLQNDYQTFIILAILIMGTIGLIAFKNQIRVLTNAIE